MGFPRWLRYVWLVLLVMSVGVGSWAAAITASNTVPVTNQLSQQNDPTLSTISPTECAALGVTVLLEGNGALTGAASNELILGGNAAQKINGGNGADCILGGAGDDTINGQGGNDVILGGDGNDAIAGGAGTGDVCYGQAGTDTFGTCETQTQ